MKKNYRLGAAAAIALGVALGTAPFAAADPSDSDVTVQENGGDRNYKIDCGDGSDSDWCANLTPHEPTVRLSKRIPMPTSGCENSASPWCVNSGLPRLGDLPQAPAPGVCEEFYSYTRGHEVGEIVSVPERLIAPARAAGCDIPPMLA